MPDAPLTDQLTFGWIVYPFLVQKPLDLGVLEILTDPPLEKDQHSDT